MDSSILELQMSTVMFTLLDTNSYSYKFLFPLLYEGLLVTKWIHSLAFQPVSEDVYLLNCLMHFKVFKYFSKNLFQETNSNATNSRVFIEAHDVNVTSWTTETYCKETVAPPVEEFHMIVKKGKISKITGICIFQIPAQILLITIFRGWNKCIEKIEL